MSEVLLSFADPNQKLFAKEFVPDYRYGEVLARLMPDRNKTASLTQNFFVWPTAICLQTSALIAKTFSRFQREVDLVAGLCVLRDDGSDFPYELVRSIENAFLERRPYGAGRDAYTLAPRGSNALRKRLLGVAHADQIRKRFSSCAAA